MTLALLMSMAMLAGCSSNNDKSSGGDTPSAANTPALALEGVKISDNYTFEDPTDLEFDTRYVLYMGPNSSMVSVSADKGQIGQYTILYAKEERAMGEYTLYVCDSAESAEAIMNEMQGYGMSAELVAEDNTLLTVPGRSGFPSSRRSLVYGVYQWQNHIMQ